MFGDLLKQLRVTKGVSQIELARAVGVSNGNVRDWERGRSKPGYDALVALSRFFKISASRLLELPTVEGLSCDSVPLSTLESDLVAMLRLLPEDAQKEIFDLVHFKYTRLTGGEKESIYWTYFDESNEQKKAPPRVVKPRAEPLNFLCLLDLVINHFSVPMVVADLPRRKARKPL